MVLILTPAVAADPTVGPWLLDAMGAAAATAADGFAQLFGIPAATTGWRVKQGWMCCLERQDADALDRRSSAATGTRWPC